MSKHKSSHRAPPFKSFDEATENFIGLMQRLVDKDPGFLIPAALFVELTEFQFRLANTAEAERKKKR